jgi:hypothetical protein
MECWVQPVDSEPDFLHVMGVLFNEPVLLPCEFQVGATCAALYEGLWYVQHWAFLPQTGYTLVLAAKV